MNIEKAIKERRSIRKYKDKVVDNNTIKEVIDLCRYSPSWANTQATRYHIINNKDVIKDIANNAVNNFTYNTKTLLEANNICIITYKTNKSGKLKDTSINNNDIPWSIFDTGIATQTFSLACHAKGLGSVIMGVIDDNKLANILKLDNDELVATLVVFGYPDEEPKMPHRFELDKVLKIH